MQSEVSAVFSALTSPRQGPGSRDWNINGEVLHPPKQKVAGLYHSDLEGNGRISSKPSRGSAVRGKGHSNDKVTFDNVHLARRNQIIRQ